MNPITFKIAAKTDVGRVRENNEDNFQAASDLTVAPMRWINNKECVLSSKGALLAVADGMGGMNAGEVASEIAIDTLRDYFSPEHITDEVVKTRYTIERFMKNAIIEADNRIKQTAREHPETHGMGTTMVIGWIFDSNLYVSWCGDSRAYIYNPAYGLSQLTKDHSYVQDLVDRGAILPEDAFDYPDNNIITRSLSDASSKARPDCLLMPHPLCDGDIILLCTDGLNGMIRDPEIEQILSTQSANLDTCADALIQAACEASGHDNVTVALCQILSGGAIAHPNTAPMRSLSTGRRTDEGVEAHPLPSRPNLKRWIVGAFLMAACLFIGVSVGFYVGRTHSRPDPEKKDTLSAGEPVAPIDTVGTLETERPGEASSTVQGGQNASRKEEKNVKKRETGDKPTGNTAASTPAEEEATGATQKPSAVKDASSKNTDSLTRIVGEKKNGLTPVRKEREEEDLPPTDEEDLGDSEVSNPAEEAVSDALSTHIVKQGEGIKKIAQKYGVTENEIIELNKIKDPDKIQAGQKIRIPRKKQQAADQ